MVQGRLLLIVVVFSIQSFHPFIFAQDIEVDFSACELMLPVLKGMKEGASQTELENQLDSILNGRPYKAMFRHYNRTWRPNHLPDSIFKKMILSLGFDGVYQAGENQRADQMLNYWRPFYQDLSLYERNLEHLKGSDLSTWINAGVHQAQQWLPPGWQIPDFYFYIHPNGGSSAFAFEQDQGYDFFQLPRDADGQLLLNKLVGTISHESHHLGLSIASPPGMSNSDSVAFLFLTAFVGEGTASKFVDNLPGGRVPSIYPDTVEYSEAFSQDWQHFTDQEPVLFDRMVTTFEKAYRGELNREALMTEIRDFWLTGNAKYPIYFVGAELFGAIYYGLGKEAAFQAMEDPRRIFLLYNQAVKNEPELLKGCPLIPEAIASLALQIGEPKE